ncbi:MAG TPA: CBS domain-containing protein [Candidatus Binataceae bacterium]|nr:CBS domain-containing protein [Candidatus Binataceae bacterium]
MASVFKKILCPVDLDDSASSALALAANVARNDGAEVYVLHVVPLILNSGEIPVFVGLRKEQQESAKVRLAELTSRYLANTKSIIETAVGEPAPTILSAAKKLPADLIIMATHGRRGFSRFFLGSIAELVMREVICPVMTTKTYPVDRLLVAHWMTHHPITITPEEKLPQAIALMQGHRFRSLPVVDHGELVGIVTDRDIRTNLSTLESLTVAEVMSTKLITVTPNTSDWDAARLVRERKIGAMPVLDNDAVVGIVSTSDLLKACTELQ